MIDEGFDFLNASTIFVFLLEHNFFLSSELESLDGLGHLE